ncbi:hypothetical protein CKO28_25455 [Rhodovibrio sodomensis]|uniref:Carbamoyltransferase n=1 Tax=Rhodovibrio sodomensis TaxID=1088 RepID=A0ABS1DLJ2_9PROT|nr:hypothetical protein [Rhodovibrio sodomensis]
MAAAQEERFTRQKHDSAYPAHAIDYVTGWRGGSLANVDYVAFYDKPFLKFERLLETYLAFAPRGFRSFRTAMPVWIKEKLFQKDLLRKKLAAQAPGIDWSDRLLFAEHHMSHAASAFYPSPFDEAVVLTLDGVGEWATTSVAIGQGADLQILKEIHFPHSLGLLYSAFTYYLGFKVNSGEYKVMGLAPYGSPKYKDLILENLLDLRDDGSFHLDQRYFNYCTGLEMTNGAFETLLGQPRRRPETDSLEPFHMDVAASVQAATEEAMLCLARALKREYGLPNLCLAGGVALNCVANGKLLRDGAFERIWVQPAAGDAGGAVGAAFSAHHQHLQQPRPARVSGSADGATGAADGMQRAHLGPAFEQGEIERRLQAAEARYEVLDEADLLAATARGLASGKAVGWFQGRMEFGPRALGARSILADPRAAEMQKILNLKVKFRESFRPFAPSVLRQHLPAWFQMDVDSPYMLLVGHVALERAREMSAAEAGLFGIDKLNVVRSEVPAVTHVDYTARLHTVDRHSQPRYRRLLELFHEATGCPMLVNTSFNIRSEPIVCTPEDAFRCFMGTDLDILVIGDCYLDKTAQDPSLARDYSGEFELD